MIKFDVETQTIYDTNQYGYTESNVPTSAIEVPDENVHQLWQDVINGYHVFYDFSKTGTARPSFKHVYVNGEWEEDENRYDVQEVVYLPLTRRQFKLTLLQNNLLDGIDAAIASIADATQKAIIQIEYQESTTFERNSPSVVAMLGILGLSDVQVNEMWLQGMSL